MGRLPLPQLAPQLNDLAPVAVQPRGAGQNTEARAGNEEDKQDQRQRGAPFPAQEIVHGYRIGILDREAQNGAELRVGATPDAARERVMEGAGK